MGTRTSSLGSDDVEALLGVLVSGLKGLRPLNFELTSARAGTVENMESDLLANGQPAEFSIGKGHGCAPAHPLSCNGSDTLLGMRNVLEFRAGISCRLTKGRAKECRPAQDVLNPRRTGRY